MYYVLIEFVWLFKIWYAFQSCMVKSRRDGISLQHNPYIQLEYAQMQIANLIKFTTNLFE